MPFTNTTSLGTLDGVDEYGTGNIDALPVITLPKSITLWVKFGLLNQSGSIDTAFTLGDTYVNGKIATFGRFSDDKIWFHNRAASFFGQVVTGQVWHHVAILLFDSTPYVDIYVDNVKQTMSAPLGSALRLNGNIIIGRFANGVSHYFDGNLNNMAVWDKLLTSGNRGEIWGLGVTPDLSTVSCFGDIIPWYQSTDGDTHPVLTDNRGVGNITMFNTEVADFTSTDVPSIVSGGGYVGGGVNRGMNRGINRGF